MARHIGIWLSFALVCAGAGCTSHRTVMRPLPPEKEAEINGMVAGREAQLTLEGGTAHDSKDMRLTGNTVRFVGREPGKPGWLPETEAPLSSLRRIEYRDHGRGALWGLGIGAGIGAVTGGVFGAILSSICVDHSNCGSPDAGATALSTLVGAAVIGLVGAGIGAAIGAPTTIEFR